MPKLKIEHDGIIELAYGLSHKTRTWRNKKIYWSNLVKKLSKPVVTNETLREYQKASKEDKLKIKDVGGYVGAYLRGSRRLPKNVAHRQLITLDVDHAHAQFWSDFSVLFENAAVVHSTHSHTAESPRLRLIMPLSREVGPDEYVAISRQVAGLVGIDLFDSTGFQPYRLMFWPSVSKDVEYYFKSQDGPFLDADEILATYADWTDSTLWPTSEAQLGSARAAADKQAEPEEKTGVVGAFCRTYSISEVLSTILTEEYVQLSEGRYTYTKGSTAGGLIVYEDKFAYSHHGTDPASGQLCNAFDLVRVHRFGHLDSNPSASNSKSFRAMEDFAMSDKRVRKTIGRERIEEARYDFSANGHSVSDSEEQQHDNEKAGIDSDAWLEELEIDRAGNYKSTANNLNLIFANDKRLKGTFKLNIFDNKRYVTRAMPWRNIDSYELMRNVDYSGIRNYIESVYSISNHLKVEDALALTVERASFHPIKDYLKGLIWDGSERVNTLLIDFFGAEDNIYTREAIRKTLVGAVARVMSPGCKFDLVLTLVGKQGTYKSTFASKLGGPYFSDSFMTVHGKESFEQLQGAWIIELAELSGLRKAEVEAVKHYISKREDTFRPAYGRTSETFRRQCIFIGTTNNSSFLRDPTGNRRFMPVDIEPARAARHVLDLEQAEVDQIWAEAFEIYKAGETLYLSEAAKEIAYDEQRKHTETDERKGIILDYLDTKLPAGWEKTGIEERRMYLHDFDTAEQKGEIERDTVCIAEIWCECLNKEKRDMDRFKTRELNELMKSLEDWEQVKGSKRFELYGTQRYFVRKLF